MEEKPNLDIRLAVANFLPEHGREEHQMVVVDPDQVTIFHIFRNGLGKEPVGFSVCVPSRFIKGDFAGMVME